MTTELSRENGNRLLPFLVQAARTRNMLTYGELSKKAGVPLRPINNALGYIRDEVCIPRNLPLITAIVIKIDTKMPGDSWLPEGTSHLSPEEYRLEFEKFRDNVFSYQGWEELLEELGLQPVEPTLEDLDTRGRAYTEMLERRGGSGEGIGHLKLKEYVAANPQAVGLSPVQPAQVEHLFIAGDRADIVFDLGENGWAVVEIKNGEIGELVKGVYQLVKYRALLKAEKGHRRSVNVDAVLVAYEIPAQVTMLAAKLGIRCKFFRLTNI
jgi:hypothetical protein